MRTFLSLIIAANFLSLNSLAGNLNCMPAALNFVLQDFQRQRQTAGVHVRVNNESTGYKDQFINLGNNIEERSINVSDIHKNAYRVEIPLRFLNDQVSHLVLRTTVRLENYSRCEIVQPQSLVYRLIK